jgi:hypothetical protein
MGAVIKFPRGMIPSRGRPARLPDAPVVVIILPVVRIERALDAPSLIKARAAKSVNKPTAKPVNKPVNKSVTKSAAGVATKSMANPAAKSAPVRKRRKRVMAKLPSPACGGR